MKHSKMMAVLAAMTMVGAAGVAVPTTMPVQAASHKATTASSFPKKWRGKWYSSNILTPQPLIIKANSLVSARTGQTIKVKMTKLGDKQTAGKLTAEITSVSKNQTPAALASLAQGSKKKIGKTTWSIITPAGKDAADETAAYTMKVEKLHGKKIPVVFEAQPDTGKVYNQYFKSKKLAKKYGNHHFKHIKYSEINYR